MPASELTQKQVGVMSGVTNIVEQRCATKFAGVVDDYVAKAKHALRNTRGNGDVLNLAERNVARGARNQARVDLNLGISQRIAHHVAPQVVIRRHEQEYQTNEHCDVGGNID